MKSAIVIGAGFGGLALAIRLQSAGVETTIVEARDKPGGRAYFWERDGFTFDAGPTVITDPASLNELWQLSGRDISEDVELMPVMPFYRLNWRDGTNFDYSNDDAQLRAEIARLNTDDVAGYQRFLEYSAGVYHEGYEKLGTTAFLDFGQMVKAAPALMKYQAWRSVYSIVSSYVKNEKLRQALSFHTLLVGGNPFTTSSIYALIHKLEKDGGVWFAKGGTNRLVAGMVGAVRAARRDDPARRSGREHRNARRPRDRGDDAKRLARRGGGGRVERRRDAYLSRLAEGIAQRASAPCAGWRRRAGRRRCSSSISGSRERGRASRTT